MILFYSIIMATNISMLFKKDNKGFKPLYRKIQKHENFAKIIIYLYFIFFGCFIFPISLTLDYTYIYLQLIGYFYLGVCFYDFERYKTLKVFSKVFLLNTTGLIFRIILEWDEHSMMKALNFSNVTLFLIGIPLYVGIIHKIILRNQENSEGEM